MSILAVPGRAEIIAVCHRASRAPSSSGAPRSSRGLEAALGAGRARRGGRRVRGRRVGRRQDAAAARARAARRGSRGARVRGECAAFGAGELAYAPIAAALRRLGRELDPAAFDDAGRARRATSWRGSCPSGARPRRPRIATRAGDAFAQARLFGMLRGLLDRLAAERRSLFAIEDLHWADRSTLEFLSSLLRGLRDERLLLVCTYRSDELHRRHPLRPFLAEEERRELVQRVELEPFSPAELAAQVAGILGRAADPALVARLHARCEGNAFFAEELLAASGGAAGPLPPSLREVLGLRLEALPTTRARCCAWPRQPAGSRPSAARHGHALARARAARGAAGGGGPSRPRPRQRRLRLPPRPARGGRLRRPAPRRADRAAPGARRGPERRPEPRGRRRAAELAHHWQAAHRMPEALAAYVRRGPGGRAGLRLRGGRAALRAGARDLGPRRRRRRALRARPRSRRGPRGAERARRGRAHRAVALGRRALELADGAGDAGLAGACP